MVAYGGGDNGKNDQETGDSAVHLGDDYVTSPMMDDEMKKTGAVTFW